MDKVFNVYLTRDAEGINSPGAQIWLPARTYELRDALQRARLTEDSALSASIDDYGNGLGFLAGAFQRPTDLRTLRGLNALAEKIAGMEEYELAAFEGLVQIEDGDGSAEIPIPRLYDLAASTHECHCLPEITDDEQLGHFFVENDFVPEVENVPDEAMDSLDYGKIGREKREEHGGVFLEDGNGYVEWDGDAVEAWKDLDLSPQEPDYTVLLEVGNPDDKGRTATLKLPAAVAEIDAVLDSLGIADNTEPSIQCLDCRASALADFITGHGRIAGANHAACLLNEMPEKDIPVYEAILSAIPCMTLEAALSQMDQVDQCILTPEIKSPADMGKAELTFMLGEDGAETLLPFVNLPAYGMELLKKENTVLTPYGAIDRKDCQPLRGLEARTADDGRQNSSVPQEQTAKPSQDGRQVRKSRRMER
ncbi:MAG: hypothetical protein IJT94_10235 [Oscillibacter sp.]|nr:hypothetical protein [Oscillibacter sp.]